MPNMYFIALVLPEHLNEKILVYKNYMKEKYECQVALKSPAHITLVPPFWMEEEKEPMLIADLNALSQTMGFPLSCNNFSAFRPRTIFIGLQPCEKLDQLKKTTDEFFQANSNYKIKTDDRAFHPHITIATRDLTKKAFHEAWPHFSDKEFSETWTAEGISLLRHNKRNWEVIYTTRFDSLQTADFTHQP